MPDLLFELGCEELPAHAVRRAYEQLEVLVTGALREAGLVWSETRTLGTPRRLILGVFGLPDRQPDREVEQRGPSLKAAYGADGQPTPALLGFCRGQGIEPTALTQKGEYVWVRKHVAGSSTLDLLKEILPNAIRAMTFDKTMRWGAARMRFVRPIRWMLASLDGVTIEFDIEGVPTGLESRGHRFYAPATFKATSWDELVNTLRERKVEPDPAIRAQQIREQAIKIAPGAPDITDALLDENVFLTEWPTAIIGEFSEEFAELPEAVLVTAMAKHEKFFPVRDAAGKLTRNFVSIRNAGVDDEVRAGNEWVLNARFNDAKFFFTEDRKKTLDQFLEATASMLFQDKLGSVRKRADRLASLTATTAVWMGLPDHLVESAKIAGWYCKSDLSSGLVSELASLQGIVAGEYARREGKHEAACAAMARQYDLSACLAGDSEEHRLSLALLIADQMDKLVGYLGVGLAPTGSNDPFGLRRAATYLIEGAWGAKLSAGYGPLLREATKLYADQGVELDSRAIESTLLPLFRGRYEAMSEGARYDVIAAALEGSSEDLLSPHTIRFRIDSMALVAQDVAFIQTASRPHNIVTAALKKGTQISDSFETSELDSAEGKALADALSSLQWPRPSAKDAVEELKQLQGPIHAFFETTMIMAEEPKIREARLALSKKVADRLLEIGDLTKLVIEG